MYVIMMYISACESPLSYALYTFQLNMSSSDPVALGVRSTNVYEEQSLGVYTDEGDSAPMAHESKLSTVGRYLSWHMRRQLAFGASLLLARNSSC